MSALSLSLPLSLLGGNQVVILRYQKHLPINIVTPRISINIMRTVTVIFLRYAG